MPKLKLTFNKNISQSLSVSDLLLNNLTTNQQVPGGSISMSYDLATNTATFTFASILSDGNYRATLPAASVSDLSGNTLAADFSFDFFTLGGDANHDRTVNVGDLGILATNWQSHRQDLQPGRFQLRRPGRCRGSRDPRDQLAKNTRLACTIGSAAAPFASRRLVGGVAMKRSLFEMLESRQMFNADLIGTPLTSPTVSRCPGRTVSATFTVRTKMGSGFSTTPGRLRSTFTSRRMA